MDIVKRNYQELGEALFLGMPIYLDVFDLYKQYSSLSTLSR